MTIDERVEKAKAFFEEGYNCSQAVYMAFADRYGLNEQLAATIAAPLGGGVGRMREVCGAVTGMALVVGLEIPVSNPHDKAAKMRNYAVVKEAGEAFKSCHGSVVCRELLTAGKHSCLQMVETAARILAEKLDKEQ